VVIATEGCRFDSCRAYQITRRSLAKCSSVSVYNPFKSPRGEDFMKRISLLVQVAILTVACSIPSHAQNSTIFNQHQLPPAARKASKKQQKAANKYAKKYAKQQRKAIRKQAKAQRKAVKQARKRSMR